MTGTIRAAQFREYGAPDVVDIGTVPAPRPSDNQVLVRVGATSVNGADLAIRAGHMRLVSGRRFPRGIGMDFAGEIAAVGSQARDFAVGDRVWGNLERNTVVKQAPTRAAAEYVVVDAKQVARIPKGLAFPDAAALVGGTTALTALRDKAHLRPGERLLVRGGTGGVGYIGVQLGHAMGAHVTALVSSTNIQTARSLGADVALDYRSTEPEDLGEFDVIFDTVGSHMSRYRRRLARKGRMVGISFEPILSGLLTVAASSIHVGRRIRTFSGNPTRALLDDYATFVANGDVRALIAGTYDLDATADAHRAAEAGGKPGKHVIVVRADPAS